LLKLKPLLLLDLSLVALLSGVELGTGGEAEAAFASVSGRNRPSTTSPPSAVRAAITPGLQQHACITEQRITLQFMYDHEDPAGCPASSCMHAAGQCYTDQVPDHFLCALNQCCSAASW
jgi:hypothetical protein